jgi:FixJ family two-component response regulator
MNGEVLKVFIVDDTREVRMALSRVLAAAGYGVRSFESAERFLSEQDETEPGCLLLDVCLPGLSGIELQHKLIDSPYARPIIFLTGMGDIQTSVQAMKEGAVDFLTKPIDHKRLFAAVERAFLRDAQQRLDRTINLVIRQRYENLTARERQVMMHVIRGRLNKQIAADLGTGEKTIKVHRARIMEKMEARSVAELVRLADHVGIAIEPTLTVGADTLEWIQSHQPIFSNRKSAAKQQVEPVAVESFRQEMSHLEPISGTGHQGIERRH